LTTGASNERYQAEATLILNEKYEHNSKIYTDGSKKEENEITIRKRKFSQN
jgi:hypothetical protein